MIVLYILTLLLQPYGYSYEDTTTPTQVIQPTENLQTTRHYQFLQGSSPDLQARTINLDNNITIR